MVKKDPSHQILVDPKRGGPEPPVSERSRHPSRSIRPVTGQAPPGTEQVNGRRTESIWAAERDQTEKKGENRVVRWLEGFLSVF